MNFYRILKEGEGTTVEFNESMGENVFKTVSAFSNTDGGILFCGISDKGDILGFDCSQKPVRIITNKILDKMGIHPNISCFEFDGKKVLRIDVEKSSNLFLTMENIIKSSLLRLECWGMNYGISF